MVNIRISDDDLLGVIKSLHDDGHMVAGTSQQPDLIVYEDTWQAQMADKLEKTHKRSLRARLEDDDPSDVVGMYDARQKYGI